ncbi:MAG TPA: DNRLRE domain-containing protein [Anaerolineales bacterium]|nr:DNRLRE domain-containing protein [Anaerolineales bacterium]
MFRRSRSSLESTFRWLRRVMTMMLIVANLATVMLAGAAPAAADTQPSFPIRAAFYYPWFPEAWNQQGFNPFTNYTPSIGFYDGGSQTVIKGQIIAMQYGGIQAGIASWWGQGSTTDKKMPALLQAAAGTNFRWSVYYENESQGNPTVAQLTSDLTYLRDRYGNDPSFLRINGRFVVFVYADGSDSCGMADRWKQANTVGAYIVLKVFAGYRNCASQPDGWHQYSPAVAADSQQGYSYAISPGFWKKGSSVVLARNLTRWGQNVKDMVASGAPFQLVTTFNEWGEGTAVESAQEWASSSGYGAYLDALHNNGGASQPAATPTTIASTLAVPTFTPTGAPTLPASLPTVSPTPAPVIGSGDPVIAAAGDISCDPADGNFKGGSGTANACREMATSDLLAGKNYAAVLTLGDNQYEDGTLTKFQQSFDPSWGRVKNIIRPAAGNHEYNTAGASGYYSYFGTAAGDKTKGYYSYNIGAWHIIALNSNCSPVGGCGAGSPQELWLKADLAAHPNACTLAYWHHPRFSSGEHGSNSAYDAFWKDLYAAGAEIVLNGHDHDYERFAPQNPSGAADPNGIQEFVVGTGGKNHYAFTTTLTNSAARNSDTYGVIRLTLHATSYEWQFIPEAGKTFTDSGSRNCVGASSPQPTLAPTNTPTAVVPPTQTPTSVVATSTPTAILPPTETPTFDPAATSTSTAVSSPTLPPTSNPVATSTPTVIVLPTQTATSNPAATSTLSVSLSPTQTPVATNVIPVTTPTQQSGSSSLTFKPVADAYVAANIPNTNYGGSAQLRMDMAPTVNSYLMFNVQGVNAPIISVKLKLYANSRSSVGIKVYSVSNNSWVEKTITFTNAPALGTPIGSTGKFKSKTWVTVDITSLVTGNGTFSIAITGLNGTAVSLASREVAAHAPQLIVTTR